MESLEEAVEGVEKCGNSGHIFHMVINSTFFGVGAFQIHVHVACNLPGIACSSLV